MIVTKVKRSKLFGGIIVFMLAFIIYCVIQNNWIEIDYLKIEINNLPLELEGVKIAHVSDVHLPRNALTVKN